MAGRQTALERRTKETEVAVRLDLDPVDDGSVPIVDVSTGVPFFDHMLHAMAFHGGIGLQVSASGDLEVDAHHVVEDVGIVLGECLFQAMEQGGPLVRFGHAVVPMDDALAEVTVDAGGRSYCRFDAAFPQDRAGEFDVWLLREFYTALAGRARINVHAAARYGDNSHHMAEALCKALGRALGQAFRTAPGREPRSTKGRVV
jgi:imidazoleglycerol-phosphate dehydratase